MLKQLKYFQSVVRLNSFSEAAEENFISQSAISQQVQALDRELGFPLLERRNRTFALTPAGEYFYQKSLILNEQRRAFSEEYVNLLLTTCESYVEISARSPLAQLAKITPHELKNTPCILVASAFQRKTEQEYYRTIIGLQGEFLYAENMEEARLMVIGRKGFLPVEGSAVSPAMRTSIVRLPLVRGEDPILRNYCAFWKKDNSGCYVEEFAELLKAQFSEQKPAAKQNLSNF